jgi:hypothetical protein
MAKHRRQPVGANPVYTTTLGAARRLTIGVPPLRHAINSRVILAQKFTAGTNVPRAQRARAVAARPGPDAGQKPPKACCLCERQFWESN